MMVSSTDLATLTIDNFVPRRGTLFDTQTSDGVVPLTLTEVEASGSTGRAGGAFSLLFVGPKGPWLPQATYPMKHPTLGTMEIFLVPIGPLAEGNGYQAVFA